MQWTCLAVRQLLMLASFTVIKGKYLALYKYASHTVRILQCSNANSELCRSVADCMLPKRIVTTFYRSKGAGRAMYLLVCFERSKVQRCVWFVSIAIHYHSWNRKQSIVLGQICCLSRDCFHSCSIWKFSCSKMLVKLNKIWLLWTTIEPCWPFGLR